MGSYNLSCDEIIESFKDWIEEQEGNVSALVIAQAWNKLGKKYLWDDTLKAIGGEL